MKKLLLIFMIMIVSCFTVYGAIEDDFNRADSTTLGTATNGNTWYQFSDPDAITEIKDNALKWNLTSYTAYVKHFQALNLSTSQPTQIDLFNFLGDSADKMLIIASSYDSHSGLDFESDTLALFKCYTLKSGQFQCYDGGWVNMNITLSTTTPQDISFRNINWTSKNFDLYIDDVAVKYNFDFFQPSISSIKSIVFEEKEADISPFYYTVDCITTDGTSCEPVLITNLSVDANTTDYNTGVYFDSYSQGQDILVYAVTNQSSAECTFIDDNATYEYSFNDNFTVCNDIGCDYVNSQTFILNSSETETREFWSIHFDVCQYLNNGDLDISFNDNTTITLTNTELPSCPTTVREFLYYYGDLNSQQLNVTFNYSEPNNRRVEITNLNLDETFLHVETDLVFNGSQFNHPNQIEYYMDDIYTNIINCTYDGEQVNDTLLITVGNVAPVITLGDLVTECGNYSLSTQSIFEYCGTGNSTVEYLFSDIDNITQVNISLSCNQGQEVSTVINGTDISFLERSLPEGYFLDFLDPNNNELNCTLLVNASDGVNVGVSETNFTITDLINPFCIGFNSEYVLSGNYTFNVSCTDEAIFSFNVSCNNGFNHYVDGLSSTQYSFTNTTEFNKTLTCSYEVCDGHTNQKIKRITPIKTKKKELKINDGFRSHIITVTGEEDDTINYWVEPDRIRYKITRDYGNKIKNGLREFTLTYESVAGIFIPSTVYDGWIVDPISKTWFDINSEQLESYDIVEVGNGMYAITIYSYNDTVEFESIGELNCITGSFDVMIPVSLLPESRPIRYGTCPDSTANMLLFVVLLVIGVVLVLVNLFTNRHLLMGLLGSFIMTMGGFTLFGCVVGIGVLFVVFGALLFLRALAFSESL